MSFCGELCDARRLGFAVGNRQALALLGALLLLTIANEVEAACQDGAVVACTTSSGCPGERTCLGSGWSPCMATGEPASCTLACGAKGTASCSSDTPGTCLAPEDLPCNHVDDDGDGQVDEGATCGATDVEPGNAGMVMYAINLAAGQKVVFEVRDLVPAVPGGIADPFVHLYSFTQSRQLAWDDDGGGCALCSRLEYVASDSESIGFFIRGNSAETSGSGTLYVDGNPVKQVLFGGTGVPVEWQSNAMFFVRVNRTGDPDPYAHLLSADATTLLVWDDDGGVGRGSRVAAPGSGRGILWVGQRTTANSGSMTVYPKYADACSDADGDGLNDILDDNPAGGWSKSKADSDGDGLLDGWEWDGVNDYPLWRVGTSPGRRDVVLENDYTSSSTHDHRLTPDVARKMRELFLTLPLVGPEPGFQGVQVHVITSTDLGNDDAYTDVCNTNINNNVARWNASRSSSLKGISHWAVGVHSGVYVTGQGDLSGDRFNYASNFGAPKNGEYGDQPGFYVYAVASHELGHNLGLLHGGHEDLNCKPNYPSLMSYAYDYVGYDVATGGCRGKALSLSGTSVRFSRGEQQSLIESALVETAGVGPTPTFASYLGCFDEELNQFRWSAATGSVDWTRDGVYESAIRAVDLTICDGVAANGATDTLRDNADHATVSANLARSVTSPGHCAFAGSADDASASTEVKRRGWAPEQSRHPPIICGRPPK